MKVVDHRHPEQVSFESLELGEVFYDHDEDWLGMKIEEIRCPEAVHGHYNAVDLKDGMLAFLNDSDYVEHLPKAVVSIH